MKNVKMTALAATVLMSVMTGSAWAQTVDVTTAAELDLALQNEVVDKINVTTHAIQLNNKEINVVGVKTVNGNGNAIYDWAGKSGGISATEQLVFDNLRFMSVGTYNTTSQWHFSNITFQNVQVDGTHTYEISQGTKTDGWTSPSYFTAALQIAGGGTTEEIVTGEHLIFRNNTNNNGSLGTNNAGIYLRGEHVKATFTDVLFEGNTSGKSGAALEADKGVELTINAGQFIRNVSATKD